MLKKHKKQFLSVFLAQYQLIKLSLRMINDQLEDLT